MENPDEAFDPATYAIIGAAIEVHRHFGPGYLEAVYHKAMAIELRHRGIPFAREVPFPLSYRGEDLGTAYRADLICEEILVELKAHSGIGDHDILQVVHYLRSSGLHRGLLPNFGLPVLQKRRILMRDPPSSVGSVRSVPAPTEANDETTPPSAPT